MAAAAERLMFANTFEGLLLRGYGARLTTELKAGLRADGIDVDRPLLPGYPLEVWLRVVRRVGERLEGGTDFDAIRRVGERFMAGYFETMVGKAVKPLLSLLGPRRTLRRMTANLRGGTSFAETTVTESSATDLTLWVNHCLADNPGFLVGLTWFGLVSIGAAAPRLDVIDHRPSGEATLRVRWG